MSPPKCFFKRPEELYSNVGTMFRTPKTECSSLSSPINYSNNCELSTSLSKDEPTIYDMFQLPRSQQGTLLTEKTEALDVPLDLSCKYSEQDRNELLHKLGNFLLQNQQQLSRAYQALLPNNYMNIERLFQQPPQQRHPLYPSPSVFVTPPPKTDLSWESNNRSIDQTHLSVDRIKDNRLNLSPQSLSESIRDISSSETSSQYTSSLIYKNRGNKRKTDCKVLRPFKLYKGNDSKGIMEALGINEADEEWLKSIVEYKSVDDVFLFLTSCMDETTKHADLSDKIIETVRMKFGHIIHNCNSTTSNPRMVRHPDMTPLELKTDEYWEKRRKNNEAAKRSREARRHKEENLNHHCGKLQHENDCLRKEIERLKIRIDEIKKVIS